MRYNERYADGLANLQVGPEIINGVNEKVNEVHLAEMENNYENDSERNSKGCIFLTK